MIHIEPQGGLANRMRVMASALALHNDTGKPLRCYWTPKPELNARFEDLFQPVDILNISYKVPFKYRRLKSSFQDNSIKYIIANGINYLSSIDIFIKDKDVANVIWNKKLNLQILAERKKHMYIKTCHNFYRGPTFADVFKPIPALQSIIDEKTSTFTTPVLGIHIRRSDNKNSILFSPTELFIQKIDKQLTEEPNSHFFLATDDEQEEKHLKNRYGTRIMTHKKILDRNSLRGVQDAIVDMYCLAATDTIWGSYWSSFSEMAATLGNKKLEVVKYENII